MKLLYTVHYVVFTVSRSVGNITLSCRSYFYADSIRWLNDYGRELDYKYINVDTIPGWEKTTTHDFQGRYISDGDFTCEARDTATGESAQRTITIVTVGKS